MTPEDLRKELAQRYVYNTTEVKDFKAWWWFEHLTEEQRGEYGWEQAEIGAEIGVDMLSLSDEELMFLWAVFKM